MIKDIKGYLNFLLANLSKVANIILRESKDVWRKLRNGEYTPKQIVLTVFAITFLWMISGLFHSAPAPQPEQSKAVNYQSTQSKAEMRQQSLKLSATLKANEVVYLRAQTDGEITALPAKEGDNLRKGDPIIVIDHKNKQELVQKAEASLRQRRIDYNAVKSLLKSKLASEANLAEKESLLYNAEAELKAAQLDLQRCTITAPFDGFLDKINVDIGNYIGPATGDLGVFMQRANMYAIASIPQKHIHDLKQANQAEVILPDGIIASGKITFISQVADEKTKTFLTEVEIDNTALNRANGETVVIKIPYSQKLAHKVAMATLLLGDDGDIVVKTINANGEVIDNKIELIEEDSGSIWISGLPEECEIITMGGHFLKNGSKIKT